MRSVSLVMLVLVTWSGLAVAAVTQNSLLLGSTMNFALLCCAGVAVGVGMVDDRIAIRASFLAFSTTVALLYFFAFGGSSYFRLAILLRYIEGDFQLPERFFGEVSEDWKKDVLSIYLIPLLASCASMLTLLMRRLLDNKEVGTDPATPLKNE